MTDKIIIYTDGGSRGNPGPAGAGAYITDNDGKEISSISKFLGEATNNFAEYEAVVLGLKEVKRIFGKKLKEMSVQVRLDSELVAKQINGEYQIKEETLFPQFISIWNMRVKDIPDITFTHIRREQNKKADALANEAMDTGN
jgi:ribonuclease HI